MHLLQLLPMLALLLASAGAHVQPPLSQAAPAAEATQGVVQAWPQTRGDWLHTGRAGGSVAWPSLSKPQVLWRANVTVGEADLDGDWADPVVAADGTVYFGSHDNCMYAIDGGSGQTKWRFCGASDEIHSAGAVLSNTLAGCNLGVVFSSLDGYLYGVNSAGALMWRRKIGSYVDWTQATTVGPDGRSVYVTSMFDSPVIYRFDGCSGQQVWNTTADSFVLACNPVVDSKQEVVVVGVAQANGHALWGLDAGSGRRLWALATDDARGGLAIVGDVVLFNTCVVMAVGLHNGSVLWRSSNMGCDQSAPAVLADGQHLALFSGSGVLTVLALASGTPVLSRQVPQFTYPWGGPVLDSNNTLLVSTEDGGVAAFELGRGRQLWRKTLCQHPQAVVWPVSNVVLVGKADPGLDPGLDLESESESESDPVAYFFAGQGLLVALGPE